MDQAKRLQDIYKLQQMIYQQTPYIPLAYSNDTEAWNTEPLDGLGAMPAPTATSCSRPTATRRSSR